jgi:hypothetical protein
MPTHRPDVFLKAVPTYETGTTVEGMQAETHSGHHQSGDSKEGESTKNEMPGVTQVSAKSRYANLFQMFTAASYAMGQPSVAAPSSGTKLSQKLSKAQSQMKTANKEWSNARNKLRKMQTIEKGLKKALEFEGSQGIVNTNQEGICDRKCYYYPLCKVGTNICGGLDRNKCVFFRPQMGGLPAGSRHSEWNEEAKEWKKRLQREDVKRRAKICMRKKRQMQKKITILWFELDVIRLKANHLMGWLLAYRILQFCQQVLFCN